MKKLIALSLLFLAIISSAFSQDYYFEGHLPEEDADNLLVEIFDIIDYGSSTALEDACAATFESEYKDYIIEVNIVKINESTNFASVEVKGNKTYKLYFMPSCAQDSEFFDISK